LEFFSQTHLVTLHLSHQGFNKIFFAACAFAPGLSDFSWCKIPKREKMYQIHIHKIYQKATNHTKWQQTRPKGLKM
jgi:hypothetical protein